MCVSNHRRVAEDGVRVHGIFECAHLDGVERPLECDHHQGLRELGAHRALHPRAPLP